ncbi:hypothetical protein H5T51_00465 [Candidatus Bathyarchaeota archaeon]|nr:hypothetical protein [Candidatus Bathyarchaeota archaeon]
MTVYSGRCSRCKKIYYSHRRGEIIVCDCWETCPLCGNRMQPYTPDLAPATYGLDGKRELKILRVCNNTAAHPGKAPFFSSVKPVEVICE